MIAGSLILGVPFDEPHTSAFTAAEVIFVVVQTVLLAGFFGIWWSGGVGRDLFGKIAFGLGTLGHILFVLLEAHSLALGELSPAFPLAPVVSAAGILLTGIAVLRARQMSLKERNVEAGNGRQNRSLSDTAPA